MSLVGKRFISSIAFLFLALSSQGQHSVSVIQGQLTATTPAIRSWKPDSADPTLKIRTRDEKGLIHAQDLEPLVFKKYGIKKREEDLLWQKDGKGFPMLPIQQLRNAPLVNNPIEKNGGNITRVLDGQGFSNINPADPSIAVGPNHIIQMINGPNGSALFSIFDKSGNQVSPQNYMDQMPGSSYNGGGDCIAWYDQLSDRFVMTEFGDSSKTGIKINTLIFAVSVTNDPTGSWYVYEFYCDSFFPDYPKYGNWHDAWYGVTRDFSDQYLGNSVWAFDKAKMIAGTSNPTLQRLRMTDADNKYNALVPVTLAGTEKPPLGTPGIFLYYSDDELTASAADKDSIGMISFKVDFTDPTKSLVKTERNFPVAAFSSMVCESRNCAPSATGQGYDVVSNRIMHKPSYRNFGGYQSIVANHTVDVNGNGLSGIRWYEIRHTSTWDIKQQGTFSPQNASACNPNQLVHRFMGSIMQNGNGQIALAYNFSSNKDDASLAFTGRNQNDPSNLMAFEETLIKKGTGYGTVASRWGDYSDIATDPSNDSIFWFTGMSGKTANTWSTTVAALALRSNFILDAKLSSISFPNSCEPVCSGSFQPRITIRNNGIEALKSIRINMSLNGIPVKEEAWTGNLGYAEESVVILSQLTIPAGKTMLKLVLDLPNGKDDEKPSNNADSIQIEIKGIKDLPLLETAEAATMPPTDWFFQTNGSSTLGWKNTNKAAFEGSRSYVFDNFNNDEKDKYADLISPVLKTSIHDSIALEFMLAAALYDGINQDTLEVLATADCGKTFFSVYKKWGPALATKTGFTNTAYVPVQSEWRKEKISLGAFAGKDIQISIRGINRYGNNMYIDNIQVLGINFLSTDVCMDSILAPTLFGCEQTTVPFARFSSLGKDSLKSLELQLWSNGILAETKKWTGNLARNSTAGIFFSPISLSPGINNIKMVVASANGKVDENRLNDTALSIHHYLKPMEISFKETFEMNSKWPTTPMHSADQWQKVSLAGAGSAIAAKNFQRPSFVSEMISPLFINNNPDSIYLDVDLGANTNNGNRPDTLELAVSWDCGKNWTNIYKKWGTALGTANKNDNMPFEPIGTADWRKEHLDLTTILSGKPEFMIKFINKGNGNNNIYLDNITITALVLPNRLKEQGYLLYPNPTMSSTSIRFHPTSTDLRSIQLTDAKGRIIKTYAYTEGQVVYIQEIDLAPFSAGVYFLKIQFRDRSSVEKLVKMVQ